ncbi:MAG: adenosine deaminase [Woeseiaceae bacterium]
MRSLMFLISFLSLMQAAQADDHWFEALKQSGDDQALYRVLHAMPKGGDLHNHNSGSVYPEWWLEHAIQAQADGYLYYTKVAIENCREYARRDDQYLLMFRTIDQQEFKELSDCEKTEYSRIDALTDVQRTAWQSSLKIDQATEGREEFFGKHWQRLNALLFNPRIRADNLARNVIALGEEGAIYAEIQVAALEARQADGSLVPEDEMIDIFRERLLQRDVVASGMTVRLQLPVLRFTPGAIDELKTLYGLAARHPDIVAAINFVGREDNDKGYPKRFLPALRELRRQHDVPLAIHGGEVDEPNQHVRDTLLLGANRIGHGLNLITDEDTMLAMRHGPYLVETNLISNLLLEYVDDLSDHPFPEYLRGDVPVALSTDDRGMWDSTLTDEFYVAVKTFNLTWPELKRLHQNSITHAFIADDTKSRLLARHEQQISKFEKRMTRAGQVEQLGMPTTRGFICQHFAICK